MMASMRRWTGKRIRRLRSVDPAVWMGSRFVIGVWIDAWKLLTISRCRGCCASL